MKKIFSILICLLLFGCTFRIEIPDVDSLCVSQTLGTYIEYVNEEDEKEVMRMFYGKYDAVSRNQVNITEESDLNKIISISYKIKGEKTSITLWSSGYGTMSVGVHTMYVKFHDGVHEALYKYITNR